MSRRQPIEERNLQKKYEKSISPMESVIVISHRILLTHLSKFTIKISEEINGLNQLVNTSSTGLAKNCLLLDKIKMEAAQEIQNAEAADTNVKVHDKFSEEIDGLNQLVNT